MTGARPGLGVTGIAVDVAALAARAGNEVLLLGAGDGTLDRRLRARPDDLPVPGPSPVRTGLRAFDAPPVLAREAGRAVDLVLLDAGASPAGRRAAAEVADHLVLVTSPEPVALDRLIAEVEIAPRAELAGPSLLGVVIVGLPAEPRQPFAEARRRLRSRWGPSLPVLDRPVRSAPFAAWLAQRHGLTLHELLGRADLLPGDHPRRAEVAGLAADHRHLARALIEAIGRAEDHPGEGWAMRWRSTIRAGG